MSLEHLERKMTEHYWIVKASGLMNTVFMDTAQLKEYCLRLEQAGITHLQVDEVTHIPYDWRKE